MRNKKEEVRLAMHTKIGQMMKTNREDQGDQTKVVKIFLIRIKRRLEGQVKGVNLNKIKALEMKWKEGKEIFKKRYWSS